MKRIILFTVAAFVLAYFVELTLFPEHKGAVTPRVVDRSDACFMSQKLVRQHLKAPATADFPMWTEENCRATQEGNTWKVRSYVDAENSFGALIRSDYGVEMQYDPSDETWTLLDVMVVSR